MRILRTIGIVAAITIALFLVFQRILAVGVELVVMLAGLDDSTRDFLNVGRLVVALGGALAIACYVAIKGVPEILRRAIDSKWMN
jgi:hypothetical protein